MVTLRELESKYEHEYEAKTIDSLIVSRLLIGKSEDYHSGSWIVVNARNDEPYRVMYKDDGSAGSSVEHTVVSSSELEETVDKFVNTYL